MDVHIYKYMLYCLSNSLILLAAIGTHAFMLNTDKLKVMRFVRYLYAIKPTFIFQEKSRRIELWPLLAKSKMRAWRKQKKKEEKRTEWEGSCYNIEKQ